MSITFSRIGQMGRVGNCMYQLAFLISMSKKYGVQVAWPKWEFSKYFQGDFTPSPKTEKTTEVKEHAFHFTPEFYDGLDWSKGMDFSGYFQSYKYFSDDVKHALSFRPDFAHEVKEKYAKVFENPVIAIHLRRGDYVENQAYINLTPTYYLSALEKNFPDWGKQNLLIFSDDQNYAKLHFGCLENAYFAKGSEIEDLCLMSQCDHFIVANSSYSWWAAFLGEKEGTKIVRPLHHFSGTLSRHDTKDFYPGNWIIHEAVKFDLTDVTFIIPVAYDGQDRIQNLRLILAMLFTSFDTNVIVMEQGGEMFEWASEFCEYREFGGHLFHRTKMLNEMAREAETPFIVNFDADVIFPPAQILEALGMLREGADVAYPYSGRFVRMNRKQWYKQLSSTLDIGTVAGAKFPLLRRGDAQSSGGAIFFNRESFWDGGGENENLISFSPDDAERFERFTKLGFDVRRVNGNLWHMEHHCGENSGTKHPHIAANRAEWQKVAGMSKEALAEYVKTWDWK